MPWCGVIGYPIAHSLSPTLHRAAYRELGLNWDYQAVEVLPGQVNDFLAGLSPECRGLAVTMPHKQEIMAALDAIDPLAIAVGAVNTVAFANRVATGFNTDVYGIRAAVTEVAGQRKLKRAVILGGRATASSALAAAGELSIGDLTIAARTLGGPGTVGTAAQRLGLNYRAVPWRAQEEVLAALRGADLVISTLPARVADELAKDFRRQGPPRPDQVLLDVSYAPWPSALVKAWDGGVVVPGWEMLLQQAAAQLKLQTGLTAPVAAMRTALTHKLAAREQSQ